MGLPLISLGPAALTLGLSQAGIKTSSPVRRYTHRSPRATLLLAAFVVHSLRRGPGSVIDVRLFADRHFAATSACPFLMGIALFGALMLLPLHLEWHTARARSPPACYSFPRVWGSRSGCRSPVALPIAAVHARSCFRGSRSPPSGPSPTPG